MPDPTTDTRLGRRLVLDELFDLSLYRALHRVAPAAQRSILDQLIPIETRHHAFWQEFFKLAHHQPELEPAAPVQPRKVELEELLPERVVARLDRDELVEDRALRGGRDPVQRPVEREIEQLVEDELAAQPGVGGRVGHCASTLYKVPRVMSSGSPPRGKR